MCVCALAFPRVLKLPSICSVLLLLLQPCALFQRPLNYAHTHRQAGTTSVCVCVCVFAVCTHTANVLHCYCIAYESTISLSILRIRRVVISFVYFLYFRIIILFFYLLFFLLYLYYALKQRNALALALIFTLCNNDNA